MSGKKVLEGSEVAVWPCVWSVCVRASDCAAFFSGSTGMHTQGLTGCQADPPAFMSIYLLNSLSYVCLFLSFIRSVPEESKINVSLSVSMILPRRPQFSNKMSAVDVFWYWCTTQYKSCNTISLWEKKKKKDIYFSRWIASCKLKIRDILFSLFIWKPNVFAQKCW